MTSAAGARYALYFAPPPQSALHRFGSCWLGRDAASGACIARPAVPGVTPERLAAITASPARYGFHATLKAPFRLADGCDEAGLARTVEALMAGRQPFASPPLRLESIEGWRALVLAEPCPRMQALCDELVAGLDRFRAASTAAEDARRLGDGRLSAREQALYRRWGYPYVFDQFRFHMTLTSPLDDAEGTLVDSALVPLVAPHAQAPLAVDGVTLFRQPAPDRPFAIAARFGFGGGEDVRQSSAAPPPRPAG